MPVFEHGVHRMKQLDGDHDQRLLGRFALGLLAEINGAPLATTAHGIDGGEVERMAGNARAHGRQARRRRAVAALVDDRVKADIRDERPRIGEACERAELPIRVAAVCGPMPGMVCSNSASEGPVPGALGGNSAVAARSTSSIALVRRSGWLTRVRTTCARAAAALPL